jgi:hypothetical protein
MDTLELTGGARIGTANATWPFATLKVDKNKLELNASIIGNLVFRPQDIISLTPYSSFMSSGLKINHKVGDYKAEVIFWTSCDATILINQIKQTGFIENRSNDISKVEQEIIDKQKSGSNPLKKTTVVVYAVLWNALLLFDFITFVLSEKKAMPISYGAISALGLLFISSVLLLTSDKFRKLFLKKGRTVNDLGRFLYLIMFICLFIMTILLLIKTSTEC